MAFENDKFGRSPAAPGLVFPNGSYRAQSFTIQDDVDAEGGYPLFGVVGEDGKAWGSLSTATEEAGESGTVYFAGVAVREAIRDGAKAGEIVAGLREGLVWVKVAEDVSSGAQAYYTADGEFGAAGTEISGGAYVTSASADGLAALEIK